MTTSSSTSRRLPGAAVSLIVAAAIVTSASSLVARNDDTAPIVGYIQKADIGKLIGEARRNSETPTIVPLSAPHREPTIHPAKVGTPDLRPS